MRSGLTTGTCAAVCAKAALLLLRGEMPEWVIVKNPQGQELKMKVDDRGLLDDGAWAEVTKDGGDDPDITHGTKIRAEVRLGGEGVRFVGGHGVGTVTKKGLQIPVGEPAINPVPRRMITDAVVDVVGSDQGVEVTVIVPKGEELAKKTLNPQLGVLGGISILGTSGIVHPMSEEAFKDSLAPQLDIIQGAGHSLAILVPGRMGEEAAIKLGFSPETMAQMSNFVGFMLQAAAKRKVKQVLLFGHIGKLAKVAAGSFHTHNKIADGRREVIAALTAQAGGGVPLISALLEANTAEEAVEILSSTGFLDIVMKELATRASRRAQEHVFGELQVGTVLTTLDGSILGYDEVAAQIGREWNWQID